MVLQRVLQQNMLSAAKCHAACATIARYARSDARGARMPATFDMYARMREASARACACARCAYAKPRRYALRAAARRRCASARRVPYICSIMRRALEPRKSMLPRNIVSALQRVCRTVAQGENAAARVDRRGGLCRRADVTQDALMRDAKSSSPVHADVLFIAPPAACPRLAMF